MPRRAYQPGGQQQRQHGGVDQRAAQVGLDQPEVVDHHGQGGRVDQAVEVAPAAPEPADGAAGRGQRQGKQAQEAGRKYINVASRLLQSA